jgi:ectoine hydroxylase-related dioxygenase (phytanoyl-CoA dioxygenase family)
MHSIHNLEKKFRDTLLFFNKLFNNLDFDKTIYEDINQNSFHVVENFLSPEDCDDLINDIEKTLNDLELRKKAGYWVDKNFSDQRLFKFQLTSKKTLQLLDNYLVNNTYKMISGWKNPQKTIMANKVSFQDNNLGSGGGWHRDSPVRTQFKAFVYLNDVNDENGPLQIIPKTHNQRYLLEKSHDKKINWKDFRFQDEQISEKNDVKTLSFKKGSIILANTKCLHRGKPLKEGVRYALTFYFGDPKLTI